MAAISPQEISPSFYGHIKEERYKTGGVNPLFSSEARDRCIDPFDHGFLGLKTGKIGVTVAGSGARRTENNDLSLASPYEFMQQAAQLSPEKQWGESVTVVNASHRDCGELFIHGAVTRLAQAVIINETVGKWAEALAKLHRYAPADAKRIQLIHKTEPEGSAPTVSFTADDRLVVVNDTYLTKVMRKYPLGQEALDRMVGDQRKELEKRGLIFQR